MGAGHEVWNQSVSQDMGVRKIGEKEVFTFLHMRNNFYEILEDTVQRFPDKTAFCDNWSKSHTYRESPYTSQNVDFNHTIIICTRME